MIFWFIKKFIFVAKDCQSHLFRLRRHSWLLFTFSAYGTFVEAKGQKWDEPKKGKKRTRNQIILFCFRRCVQVRGGKFFVTVIIIYYDFTPLRVCPLCKSTVNVNWKRVFFFVHNYRFGILFASSIECQNVREFPIRYSQCLQLNYAIFGRSLSNSKRAHLHNNIQPVSNRLLREQRTHWHTFYIYLHKHNFWLRWSKQKQKKMKSEVEMKTK